MTPPTKTLPLALAAAALAAGLWMGSSALSGAATLQEEKHGQNIVFFVKKNRQKRPHVLFSHDSHLGYGHECRDCHNDTVFKSEKKMGVNEFSMKDINDGEACGACHDGETVVDGRAVFAPKGNCAKCHNVKWRGED